MAANSKIEWTETTWNVISGCTRVSAGCDHCYIERTPPFRMAGRRFDKPGIGGTTGVTLHRERLERPLRWRKPRRVFVNSLADLFHEAVPAEFIADAFAVMALAPQHTFQVLTKRHGRMRSLLSGSGDFDLHEAVLETLTDDYDLGAIPELPWPLPNVWLGVSVESQQWADIRVPTLMETPAAVRWLSMEPLLGPVDLADDWLAGPPWRRNWLDWIVIGGESGPGARPMELEWADALTRRCQDAGVPVFVKQLGSRWGKNHHDIDAFPEALQVRQYPDRITEQPQREPVSA